jgi:hypothetical protein
VQLTAGLTAICESIVYKMVAAFMSQPYIPPWPVTDIVLLFFFLLYFHTNMSYRIKFCGEEERL